VLPPLWAQHSPAPALSENACQQETEAAAPHAPAGRATAATVIQVDPQRGLLNLETDIGRVLTYASLEDLQGLHEGDQIVVCLVEEDPTESVL
jgi:hypothetical protein